MLILGQIYGSSARIFRVDGRLLPYAWNHTIFYDADLYPSMPHLVEQLVVNMPNADVDARRNVSMDHTGGATNDMSLIFQVLLAGRADLLEGLLAFWFKF